MGKASLVHGYLQDYDQDFLHEVNFIDAEIDNLNPAFCSTCQVIGRLLDNE